MGLESSVISPMNWPLKKSVTLPGAWASWMWVPNGKADHM